MTKDPNIINFVGFVWDAELAAGSIRKVSLVGAPSLIRELRRNEKGCLTRLRKDWRRLRRSYLERLCSGTRTTTASG